MSGGRASTGRGAFLRPRVALSRRRAEHRAFLQEEKAGAWLTLIARVAALACLVLYVLWQRAAGELVNYYLVFTGILFASGLVQFKLARLLGSAPTALIRAGQVLAIGFDMAVLTVALVVPSPFAPEEWHAALQLRVATSSFLFVLIALAVIGYSPLLTFWAGLAAALAWLGGYLWVLSRPESLTLDSEMVEGVAIGSVIEVLLQPGYVSTIGVVQEAILFVVCGGLLSVAVWRSRRYARQQVGLSIERGRLARYFAPEVAETLMNRERERPSIENRHAAVMFVDMVGFTAMAETLDARTTVLALRRFHERIAEEVFTHKGTVVKYIGDEVMATFGAFDTAIPPERAAAQALACATAIADSFDTAPYLLDQNETTRTAIGVGVHSGDVVVGDAGGGQLLELAVIGDTVNIAKRLEREARLLGAVVATSAETLDRACADNGPAWPRLGRGTNGWMRERFEKSGQRPVRGRRGEIDVAFLRPGLPPPAEVSTTNGPSARAAARASLARTAGVPSDDGSSE
ncbi:MAG: adenylate/guanylate cyclase domain-containing protein [Pseudomonadota bacterium]